MTPANQAPAVTFKTTILSTGKNTTGIVVPHEIVEALGAGKRPPVKVTINGYTYRSSIAVMDGDFMVGVSAEVREKASVAGGDELEVRFELDSEPRVVVVPPDFKVALDREPAAKSFFEKLSYSNRRQHVMTIEDAKTPETRERRIVKSVQSLKEGKA